MRPRVFPAEDAPAGLNSCAMNWGFNEAAGIPRGRPAVTPPVGATGIVLQ